MPATSNTTEERSHTLASAITEVTERASLLIREEIELAKAEMSEKASKLARGAIVASAAGIFVLSALIFILIGCAWLLYWALPIGGDFTYFYGFFVMAGILLLLGAVAGLIALRVLKRASPPTPQLAIEEARKITQTMKAPEGLEGATEELSPVPDELLGGSLRPVGRIEA